MATKVEERLIRVFCPEHEISFPAAAKSEILCEGGKHFLTQKFPFGEFWQYCCACQTFYPFTLISGGHARAECSYCDRSIAHWYLCEQCKIITVASYETVAGGDFTISQNGRAEPSCPGCLKFSDEVLGEHLCHPLSDEREDNIVIFTTALTVCPFCRESIDTALAQINEDNDVVVEDVGAKQEYNTVPVPSFQLLTESGVAANIWGWLRPRIRVMTLITICSFILAIISAPPIYNFYVSATEQLPTLEKIRCDKQRVVVGERVPLMAVLKNADGLNPLFDWKCTPCLPGQIEGNGPEVSLNTGGIDTHLGPVHLTVSLKLRGHSKEGAQQDISLEVISPDSLNRPPVLKGIKCPSQEVKAGDLVTLTAFTEDADKDELIYNWQPSTSTAHIEGNGQVVTLNTSDIHPQSIPVPVKVTLTVNDGHGGSVTNDITINVAPAQPPRTAKEAAVVSPTPPNNAPRIISFQPDRSAIQAGESVTLDATVQDPDNDKLLYSWENTGGHLEGQGRSVTLKTSASDFSSTSVVNKITVTLTVTDGRGARTSQDVHIDVLPPQPPAKTPTVAPSSSPKTSL